MKIGLIGCGRLGLTIGHFLSKTNNLHGIYDISRIRLYRAIKILKIQKNPNYRDLIRECDILLFATPDDKILNAFKRASKYITSKKYVFHFSGLLPAEIFPKSQNLFRGSLHPFATFPQKSIQHRRKKYSLFFQGDSPCFRLIRIMFPKKDFVIHSITSEQKPIYHLIGIFSCNFIVALSEVIRHLAKNLKWTERDFKELILPLMMDTIVNIREYGIKGGLSGPMVRGDIESIKQHLAILRNEQIIRNLYCSLSQIIIKYAPINKRRKLRQLLNHN